MRLLDVFKKKKPAFAKASAFGSTKSAYDQTKSAGKKEVKKKEKKAPKLKKKEEIREIPLGGGDLPQKVKRVKKRDFSNAYKILKEAHVTEKATDLGKENKYVFKVFPRTNKVEIKKAVQDLYGVEVLGVNIINIHRKTKGTAGRRRAGHKTGYRKAIVTLAEGEKIELMPH